MQCIRPVQMGKQHMGNVKIDGENSTADVTQKCFWITAAVKLIMIALKTIRISLAVLR